MKTIQKIEDTLKEADIVIVGIGEEFTFSKQDYLQTNIVKKYVKDTGNTDIPDIIKALAMRELDKTPYIQAYNTLAEVLKGKTYYVNTLNMDDIIFQSNLKKECITAPCGSFFRMQCNDGCDDHIFDGTNLLDMVYQYWYTENIPWEQSKPECEKCGQELVPNTIHASCYLEHGYMDSWTNYKSWIQKILDKKICVLELGVGFSYPEVIRWPLEKVVYLSNKAFYVRVNEKYPQLSKEIHDKGVSFAENALCVFSEYNK